MRATIVHPGAHFSVHDVAVGWKEGLEENGLDVAMFNLQDRLTFYANVLMPDPENEHIFRKAVPREGVVRLAAQGLLSHLYQWWPDVVVVISGFFMAGEDLDIIRSRGHKIVMVHTESPYEDPIQIQRAQHADLNIINDPLNIEQFPPGTMFLPPSYRPRLHCPGPADPALVSDFAFVGTGFNSRVEFFEAVDWSGIDVALGGNWPLLEEGSSLLPFVVHSHKDECLDNAKTIQLYRATKASVNIYRREGTDDKPIGGWAVGPREVELAATGTFFLRDPRPQGDVLFPQLPTVSSPEEFGDKLRWYLQHPETRADAARHAREAVRDWTFQVRTSDMLKELQSL